MKGFIGISWISTFPCLLALSNKSENFIFYCILLLIISPNLTILVASLGNNVCFTNSSSVDCIGLIQRAWLLNSTEEAKIKIEQVSSLISDHLYIDGSSFEHIDLVLGCLSTRRVPFGAACISCNECLNPAYYYNKFNVCESFCPTIKAAISSPLSRITELQDLPSVTLNPPLLFDYFFL